MATLNHLGSTVSYPHTYEPKLLEAVSRQPSRGKLFPNNELPFSGCDVWNAYEVSWLEPSGKPCIATVRLKIPCSSPHLIESKSLKLYLNSLNQSKFRDEWALSRILTEDLSRCAEAPVEVSILGLALLAKEGNQGLPGYCLDGLEVRIDAYTPSPEILEVESDTEVQEQFHSHLLKTNCPITHQPDWGSLLIDYVGPKISRTSLLKYIISYRQHCDFHEHCIERIFVDLLEHYHPNRLSVQAHYLRRGGIDINPFRSNWENEPRHYRLPHQ